MEESKFKFLGYKVTKIDVSIADDFPSQAEKMIPSVNVENNFSQENKRFVEVVLNISVKTESNKFNFVMQIKGAFDADEQMTDELFGDLAKQNGPAILFPFARAIITNYTALANVPPIIIPLMNFTKKK